MPAGSYPRGHRMGPHGSANACIAHLSRVYADGPPPIESIELAEPQYCHHEATDLTPPEPPPSGEGFAPVTQSAAHGLTK